MMPPEAEAIRLPSLPKQFRVELGTLQPGTSHQVQEEAEVEVQDQAILAQMYDQHLSSTSLQTHSVQEYSATIILPLSDKNCLD
uniref:Uncharacterized protein n=1 Tax=Romanomermis culicivorax TaxID=13658 RepID=A0A915KBL4_ROMCU